MKRAARWTLSLPRGRLVAAVVMALALTFVVTAGAAPQFKPHSVDFKGHTDADIFNTGDPLANNGAGICDECIPDALAIGVDDSVGLGASLKGGLNVEWTNPVQIDMSYTDSLVRQGETLDMQDALATKGGKVKVTAFLEGYVGIYERGPNWSLYSKPFNERKELNLGEFDCTIPLPGESQPPRRCPIGEAEKSFPLFEIFGIGVSVRFKFELFLDSKGTPIGTLRVLTTAGGSSGGLQKPLAFEPSSPDTVNDDVFIPCTEPVGNDVFYKLTQNAYTADSEFVGKPSVWLDFDAVGFTIVPIKLWEQDIELMNVPDIHMTTDDIREDLGPLKPDNRPPVLSNISAPNGNEGSEIQFHVDATDNCGPPAVRWDFSDGGVAFGTDPKHTFLDDGHYTGQIMAKDDTGNTTTKNFALDIANLKPVVNAGPDDSADWGRAVSFNGQATDPGWGDQPTLHYTWDFGDGTPSATGGPSVAHAYSAPNTYTAKLTVCDKDGACESDTRDVVVTKRDTSIGYLGDTAGTFDTAANLSASLVDEYGQTVNGRTIAFNVGTDGNMNALTNSSGIAGKSYTPTLAAGAYTGTSAFAGDSLYKASSSSNAFAVAKKATTTVYTGATTGGPNKTVVLSATLKDATGKPLAGRTIAFQLGSQAVSAVTNANGAAAADLKLLQKNGTYTVSATYTPPGADAPYYLGSGQGVIFKLQAK